MAFKLGGNYFGFKTYGQEDFKNAFSVSFLV